MNNASVCVVIPAYNAEKTITRAINSVLQNDLKNLEVIVIDDHSTDNTFEICSSIKDGRLKVFKNDKNRGVAYSRNIGIKKSHSDYIAFLDADDYWYENKLSQQLLILEKSDPNLIGCYTHLVVNGIIIREAPESVDFKSLCFNGNDIGLSSTIIKYSSIKEVEFEKIGHEDYKFWLELLSNGGYFQCSSNSKDNEQMTYYDNSSKSLSSNKLKAAIWTFNILYSFLPLHIACYCFGKYIIKHIKRTMS